MNQDEIKAVFERQAPDYDNQWTRMSPIYNSLYFLLGSVFDDLPSEARILCVGVGTGKELIYLANRFPLWRFTAVEPSSAMLNVCRHQVEEAGFTSRCYFHEGYLDSLMNERLHDAATCFLVSQFILDQEARSKFFREIADRLKPNGILVNSDLSSGMVTENYEELFRVWHGVMAGTNASLEGLNRMIATYAKDVAVLSPAMIASIIMEAGFETPVQFFQAGLIHAWFAKCTLNSVRET